MDQESHSPTHRQRVQSPSKRGPVYTKKKTVGFKESDEHQIPDEKRASIPRQDSIERLIDKYTARDSPRHDGESKHKPKRKRTYSPRETVKHVPPPTQYQQKEFNFEKYHFLGPYGNFRQAEYLEELLKETKANKSHIKRQMSELVYVQVLNRINHEFPALPAMFHDNKQKWSMLMLKSKQFQDIMGEYSSKLTQLIEREVTQNRQMLGMYLTHPRIFKHKVPQGMKIPKDIKLHEMGSLNRDDPKHKTQTSFTSAIKANQQLTPGSNEQDGASSSGAAPIGNTPKKSTKASILHKKELSKKEKEEKEKQEMSFLNAEYKKIMDRVRSIDSIVDRFGEAQDELSQDVMAFEHEATEMENQLARDGTYPLQKITEMLDRWSQEPIHTQDEIQRFANELWVSLQEYEKDIKDGIQGHQIIIAMKEHKYMQHIEWIKNKFGFYVELYEQAFAELKLKQRREVDRVNMSLCELESRLMNYQLDEDRAARLAREEIPAFAKVQDANEYIKELKNLISVQFYESKQKTIFNQDLANQVANLEKERAELQEQVQQWQHLFQYYQGMCIKKAKDLGILEAQMKFDINEALSPLQQQEQIKRIKNIEKLKAKMDLGVQEELVRTFEEVLRFNQVMQETTTHYKLYNSQIKTVYQELVRMGVIPAMRVKSNKNVFEQQTTTLTLQDQDRFDLFDIFDELQQQTNQSFSQHHQLAPKKEVKKPSEAQKPAPAQHTQAAHKAAADQSHKAQVKQPVVIGGEVSKGSQSPPPALVKEKSSNPKPTQDKLKPTTSSNTNDKGEVKPAKKPAGSKAGPVKGRRASIQSLDLKEVIKAGSGGTGQVSTLRESIAVENKLAQAKQIADVEEAQFIEQKYNLAQFEDDLCNKEGLTEFVRLDQQQRFELQMLVEQCFGKDLGRYEANAFDALMKCESVEAYIDCLNGIMRETQRREREKLLKTPEQRERTPAPEINEDLLDEAEVQRRKKAKLKEEAEKKEAEDKKKNRVPLGDCLQFEYDEQKTELVGFTLRPKLAQYMLFRDGCDLTSIRESLRVLVYLNRMLHSYQVSLNSKAPDLELLNEQILLTPEAKVVKRQPLYEHYANDPLLATEEGHLTESDNEGMVTTGRKIDTEEATSQVQKRLLKIKQRKIESVRKQQESIAQSEKLRLEVMMPQATVFVPPPPKVVRTDQSTQVRFKQLIRAQGIDDQGLINMIKGHVVDISCRISTYMQDKIQSLFSSDELTGDNCQPALAAMPLKGIQYQGLDLTVEQYLALVFDQIHRRIKGLPPFKRKVLDLKQVLDSLNEAPSDLKAIGKDYMAATKHVVIPTAQSDEPQVLNPIKRANYYSTGMSFKEKVDTSTGVCSSIQHHPQSSGGRGGVFSLTQGSQDGEHQDEALFAWPEVTLPQPIRNLTKASLATELFPDMKKTTSTRGALSTQKNWMSTTVSSQLHTSKPKTAANRMLNEAQKQNGTFFTMGASHIQTHNLQEPSVLMTQSVSQSDPHSRNFTQFMIDKQSITHRVGGRQVNLAVALDPASAIQTSELLSEHMHSRSTERRKLASNPFKQRARGLNLSFGMPTMRRGPESQIVDILINRDKEMSISEETDINSSSRVATASYQAPAMIEAKLERDANLNQALKHGKGQVLEIPTIVEAESRSSKDAKTDRSL